MSPTADPLWKGFRPMRHKGGLKKGQFLCRSCDDPRLIKHAQLCDCGVWVCALCHANYGHQCAACYRDERDAAWRQWDREVMRGRR